MLSEGLPKVPTDLSDVSVGDIPQKYFAPLQIYATAGICIDSLPHHFKTMIKNAETTQEKEYDTWK